MLIEILESSLAYYEAHAAIVSAHAATVNDYHIRPKFQTFLSANGLLFLIRLNGNGESSAIANHLVGGSRCKMREVQCLLS